MIAPNTVDFSSTLTIDRILGTYSGTQMQTIVAPGASSTISTAEATNIPETTLFTGVFSIDGGLTWYALGTMLSHTSGWGSLQVWAESTANAITIKSYNSQGGGAGVNSPLFTILYRVALLAKPDQGDVTPQPIGSKIYFDSRLNYQKIALDDVRVVSAASIPSITHGAGGVTKFRVLIEDGGVMKPKAWYSSGRVAVDSTSIVYNFSVYAFANVKLYTRVYYSEQ